MKKLLYAICFMSCMTQAQPFNPFAFDYGISIQDLLSEKERAELRDRVERYYDLDAIKPATKARLIRFIGRVLREKINAQISAAPEKSRLIALAEMREKCKRDENLKILAYFACNNTNIPDSAVTGHAHSECIKQLKKADEAEKKERIAHLEQKRELAIQLKGFIGSGSSFATGMSAVLAALFLTDIRERSVKTSAFFAVVTLGLGAISYKVAQSLAHTPYKIIRPEDPMQDLLYDPFNDGLLADLALE